MTKRVKVIVELPVSDDYTEREFRWNVQIVLDRAESGIRERIKYAGGSAQGRIKVKSFSKVMARIGMAH